MRAIIPAFFLSVLLALLTACQAGPASTPASSLSAPASGQILPFSFRTQAFDGQQLWQVLREDKQTFLIKTSLLTQQQTRIPMSSSVPPHRSLAWGRDSLWMLDFEDTLYQIDVASGKVLKTLALPDLPEARASEQIAWGGDELWLLMRPYVSSKNQLETARFLRLDPESGKTLETRQMPGSVDSRPRPSIGFSDFLHQNLQVDATHFYVLRSALFELEHNLLYKIDKKTLAVSHTPLKRVFTGVPTFFFWQGQPYGIELLDTTNCGEYCRGKLEKLPQS